MTNQYDELLDLTTRLKAALEHPEPGLISWHLMVANLHKSIADLWNNEDDLVHE